MPSGSIIKPNKRSTSCADKNIPVKNIKYLNQTIMDRFTKTPKITTDLDEQYLPK